MVQVYRQLTALQLSFFLSAWLTKQVEDNLDAVKGENKELKSEVQMLTDANKEQIAEIDGINGKSQELESYI